MSKFTAVSNGYTKSFQLPEFSEINYATINGFPVDVKESGNNAVLASAGTNGQAIEIDYQAVSEAQGTTGGLTSYIGSVSSRAKCPNSISSNKQGMSIIICIADSDIKDIGLTLPNFYVNSSGVEVGTGATSTWHCSVEYPLGSTPKDIKLGGSLDILVPDLSLGKTDRTTINIPKGSKFALRLWQSNPIGIAWLSNFFASSPGDGFTVGTTTPDVTRSNTTITQATVNGMLPIGILGTTTQDTIVAIGDSTCIGRGDTGDTAYAQGWVERSFVGRKSVLNIGVSGEKAETWVAGNTALRREAIALASPKKAIIVYGTNDISASRSPSTIVGYIQAIGTLINIPYLGATIPPRTTSTDLWVTIQTVLSTEAVRKGFNKLLRRGGLIGSIGIIDIANTLQANDLWLSEAAGRSVTDGVTTAGSSNLDSASAVWTSNDTGSLVTVSGAGVGGAPLLARITYVSGTRVSMSDPKTLLSLNASTTTTNAPIQIDVNPITDDGIHSNRAGYITTANSGKVQAAL